MNTKENEIIEEVENEIIEEVEAIEEIVKIDLEEVEALEEIIEEDLDEVEALEEIVEDDLNEVEAIEEIVEDDLNEVEALEEIVEEDLNEVEALEEIVEDDLNEIEALEEVISDDLDNQEFILREKIKEELRLENKKKNKKLIVRLIIGIVALVAVGFGGVKLYDNIQLNKEVDAYIKNIVDTGPKTGTKIDGKAQKGNIVLIDFEGYKDGKKFEGGSAKKYSLELGSNSFIPGFEDQLINKKAGDNVDVKVTFPTDYQSTDLAGKAVVFKVKVLEVQKAIPNVLNDEFVARLGNEKIKTVEQLRKYVKDGLKQQSQSTDTTQQQTAQ